MKILALATMLGGCFVLPKTNTTTRDLGTEEGMIDYGPTKSVQLQASLDGATIEVRATETRDCTKPIYRVTEVTKEKSARWRGNKDARSGLFALILAPVTVPVSALVTGIVVLQDGDGTVSRQQAHLRNDKTTCTGPARGVHVAMKMPSGATFTDITDEEGVSRMGIAASEPYKGVVSISAPKAESTELKYTRAMPAIVAVRETVMTCAGLHHVVGSLRMQISIDDGGRAMRIGLDKGDGAFATCVNEGLANTQFGKAHHGANIVLPFELPG